MREITTAYIGCACAVKVSAILFDWEENIVSDGMKSIQSFGMVQRLSNSPKQRLIETHSLPMTVDRIYAKACWALI